VPAAVASVLAIGWILVGIPVGTMLVLDWYLKEAPKNLADRTYRRKNEHLDAAAGVDGIEAFYQQCVARGAKIVKPLAATE
jgi:hypothetical protein